MPGTALNAGDGEGRLSPCPRGGQGKQAGRAAWRVPRHGGWEGPGGTSGEAAQVRQTVWADSGGERGGVKRKHFLGKDISSTYLGCREEGGQPWASLRKQGLRRHHVLVRSRAHTDRGTLQARDATFENTLWRRKNKK